MDAPTANFRVFEQRSGRGNQVNIFPRERKSKQLMMRGLNGLGHLLINFAPDRFQKSQKRYVGGKPVPNSFSLAMSQPRTSLD
jgi:hypothetical protein